MRVLLTGAHGRVGTAIMNHLEDEYEWTLLDRDDSPDRDTVVVDVGDRAAIGDAVQGHDAVVHLAADPGDSGTWELVLENNLIGCYNVLHAASEAGVERFVFASTNHVLGGWKDEAVAELFSGEMVFDDTTPIRPDSPYGVSKVFGEALCRYTSTTRTPHSELTPSESVVCTSPTSTCRRRRHPPRGVLSGRPAEGQGR